MSPVVSLDRYFRDEIAERMGADARTRIPVGGHGRRWPMTDQPMSQWPSEWEYVLPVRPGPDAGHDHHRRPRGPGPERRAADQGGAGARHLHPALLLARAHEAGRHVPHVPRRGRGAARAPDRVRDPGLRRHGRPHAEGQRAQGAGRRPRVPPHQPPARLPGLRPRRRVPAPGPDARVRSGRVALRRGEAPLREADPDQRPRAARPRALHPVRALHALRRRDRRRPADRLRRPRRAHRGDHLSRRAVHVVLLRQHRADLPGRRAHREAVPVRAPGRGTSRPSRRRA